MYQIEYALNSINSKVFCSLKALSYEVYGQETLVNLKKLFFNGKSYKKFFNFSNRFENKLGLRKME